MRNAKVVRWVLVVAVLVAGCRRMPGAGRAPRGDVEAVVQGNTAFAVDLYRQLRTREGNLFFSPYSISTASALVYAGARGNTQKEMATALHFALPPERLHAGLGALQAGLNAIQQAGHVKLSVANSLWIPQGGQILDDYLKLTETYYGASITSVDYSHAQQAADQINGWVREKTEGRIDSVVNPDMLDGLTRLVLVNAVYFKGTWHYQFDPRFTHDMPFHLGSGESVQTPMMAGTVNVRYGTVEGLQILELPYVGKEVSMIILLPKAVDGLKSIEDSLSAEKLSSWRKRLERQEVLTYLPKFTMTCDFELNEALRAMGMVDAFVPSAADLSAMTGDRSQYVDAVLHRAFVEVNEEGTEAAATTGMVTAAARDAARRHPPVFCADHPFLFLIQNKHGAILFLGRVVDPRTRSV